MTTTIAWFISPHGFGHAARSCAVMEALRSLHPDVNFEIYTLIPEWFFADSLGSGYHYHTLETDIGLVQSGPFTEDLSATLSRLKTFIPFSPALLDRLAAELCERQVKLAVCDISPLGIAAARQAAIPSVLIENFTWDWIYAAYLDREPGLAAAIHYLAEAFLQADLRIQTDPECWPLANGNPIFPPASRQPRLSRAETRRALGIPGDEPAILVSFGGIPMSAAELREIESPDAIHLVMPLDVPRFERRGRLTFLPHHSEFYHPDLMNACDAVVGKVGYSTLAEAYRAGRPFGYLTRAGFPESPVMADFIRKHMSGFEIRMAELEDGSWVRRLPALLELVPTAKPGENGARAIAEKILGALKP